MKRLFTLLSLLLLIITTGGAKQLYLCGDAPAGNGWDVDAAHQVAMTLAADGVTNTATITATKQIWFTISDGPGSDWDDYNANHRYGMSSGNYELSESRTYQLDKYNNAGFTVMAGTYEISINSETMVMELKATVAPPPAEDSYYVVGSSTEVFGASWSLDQKEPYMTKQDDGTYQWVKSDVTLAKSTIEWKVIKNPSTGWGVQYGPSGKGDNTPNIQTEIESDGVYTLTFKFDLSNGDNSVPTVEVKKTADATVDKVYTLVGDESLTGSNWDVNDENNNMTLNETTGLYEKTITKVTLEANKEYKVKVVTNHSWDNQQFSDNGNDYIIKVGESGEYDVTVTLDVAAEKIAHTATKSTTTGISLISNTSDERATLYNLAGQRVGAQFKGIVVKNGKKFIVR